VYTYDIVWLLALRDVSLVLSSPRSPSINCHSPQLVYIVRLTRHYSTHSTSMDSYARRSTEDMPNSKCLLSVNLH